MGIDFSHGEAHWAYSGFMRFRGMLVKSLGYAKPLSEMYDDGTYVCMNREPIYPLINHSDCEGDLTVEEMRQILPQLRSILNEWDDNDFDKQRGLNLVAGMEDAISEHEPMEFR